MKALKVLVSSILLLSMLACEQKKGPKTIRWYGQWQLNLGEKVYQASCVKCHGIKGAGTMNQTENQATGFYPAPTLNATSDSLQRPLSVLADIVNDGGSKTDGNMPAFRNKLSASEKLSVVAYFQSFWSDEDYQQWLEWGGLE